MSETTNKRSSRKVLLAVGFDFGHYCTKIVLIYDDGSTEHVLGAGPNGAIVTEMYHDAETGEWYHDRYATEAAYGKREGHIKGIKANLTNPDKIYLNGTMTAVEAAVKFIKGYCVPLIERQPFAKDKVDDREWYLNSVRVEEGRVSLSRQSKVTVAVPLPGGKRVSVDVTGDDFESVLRPFIGRALGVCDKTLAEAAGPVRAAPRRGR